MKKEQIKKEALNTNYVKPNAQAIISKIDDIAIGDNKGSNQRISTTNLIISSIQKGDFVLEYKKKNFLEEFLQDLLYRNISSILVEGGQKTLNAFIVNNLFDELVLYTAPMFLGKGSKDALSVNSPDAIRTSMKLKMVRQERFKEDIKTTYYNKNL